MVDIKKDLASKFLSKSRYQNFGHVINSIKIDGFRGLSCQLDLEYPVTAITGLNGAGKSTIGQLLLCAYKQVSTAQYKRFYVKDFFPVSIVDPAPFNNSASVEYRYQTGNQNEDQVLTVSRASKEWSGYKRQPEKTAIYIGLAFYLPKVERPDLTIYSAKNITLSERAEVESGTKWATLILGNTYDEVFFQGVKNASRKAELGMASRMGAAYSENNMGFGEGRVIHTIRLLESCPINSLIILEEPETSLHESAQYEFVKYLLDVSFRRGHQIVFSTHSTAMISALPPEGRKMLQRNLDGVSVYDRLSSVHMRTALNDGQGGHLIICVEDHFAALFLRELIRLRDIDLLKRIKIIDFGDVRSVKSAVKALKKSQINAIGILDGDQNEIIDDNIYVLPGEKAPEKVIVISEPSKKLIKTRYGFDLERLLIAEPDLDHHQYISRVAAATGNDKITVEVDCCREFLNSQDQIWGVDLINKIKKNC